MKILIVDDCADLRDVLAELLQLEGFEPIAVGDGPSAISAARDFHPTFALVDLHLPDLTGTALARLLHATHPQMRLVAMTGDPDFVLGTPFEGMLRKPFSPDDLTAIVQALTSAAA